MEALECIPWSLFPRKSKALSGDYGRQRCGCNEQKATEDEEASRERRFARQNGATIALYSSEMFFANDIGIDLRGWRNSSSLIEADIMADEISFMAAHATRRLTSIRSSIQLECKEKEKGGRCGFLSSQSVISKGHGQI